MRLFFDTNVWITAFIAHGLCADLVGAALSTHDARRNEVQTCPAMFAEARRLLVNKYCASEAQLAAAQRVFQHIISVPDGTTSIPPDSPDPDDWPIIAAALAAHADLFVTGDKALLALGRIGRLESLDPRTAYQRLRGLA